MAGVTFFRAVLLIAVSAAVAVTVDRLVLNPAPTLSEAPGAPRSDPAPGSPPLVWLDGTLEQIGQGSLAIREGEGARVDLERAAAGGTRFFRLDGDTWAVLSEEDAEAVDAGQRVCVEALLDGRNLLALRVFMGAGCGPARIEG
jgi:hypothetical protein